MNEQELAHPGLARIHVVEDGNGLSRADAILKGALAVGALYGIATVGPYVGQALAASGGKDVETLNFLLRFEYLQADIYDRGVEGVNWRGIKLSLGKERRALVEKLASDEHRHVDALKAMVEKLGGKPEPKGEYAFSYRGAYVFLSLAGELEQAAIGAYNGVIPSIKSKAVQELAGSIVQVEGRHAAAINLQKFEEPAPKAFDEGLTEYTAVSSVLKFTGEY